MLENQEIKFVFLIYLKLIFETKFEVNYGGF